MSTEFYEKVNQIISRHPRYKVDAYEFMMQALWFTQEKLKRNGHVSAKELAYGAKEYGLDLYGPMTRAVFEHWGIRTTGDFGEIVFDMIDSGIMSKSDNDTKEDFRGVYDFDQAFDIFNLKEGGR